MQKTTKKRIEFFLVIFIGFNAFVFLLLAYLQKLSIAPKDLVFIDFWGRLCVYSLWFTGYALYLKYLPKKSFFRKFVMLFICMNIPFFLLLGYFNKLSTDPRALPFIDFWGRLTVYSLWFMMYEIYRKYIQEDSRKNA